MEGQINTSAWAQVHRCQVARCMPSVVSRVASSCVVSQPSKLQCTSAGVSSRRIFPERIVRTLSLKRQVTRCEVVLFFRYRSTV